MGVPLFVSERSGSQTTTRPLSVGSLIFAPMDRLCLAVGQQALMHDEEVLALIRKHVQRERLLFPSAPEHCFVVLLVFSRGDR